MKTAKTNWPSNGLAHWIDGKTANLSVAFTWRLPDAYQLAIFYRSLGLKVRAGGPAILASKGYLSDVAECGGVIQDAIHRHNQNATIASRGCPVGCWFCIVPKLEGRQVTLIPEFPVRPILCDNNLSALPADYQEHVVRRYETTGVPLLDANSGFEPRTFDEAVFRRWSRINRGPWRFAYDDAADRPHVDRVMRMLQGVSPRRKQVYVLIGNEPIDACMNRIREVIAWGGEPHVQPFIKLNALEKKPHVRFDWTIQTLRDVARWANSPPIWRKTPFSEYRRSTKTRIDSDDRQAALL